MIAAGGRRQHLRSALAHQPRASGIALTLIVLVGSVLAARWSLAVNEWRVMTDEMGYVKVALSISHSLLPFPDVRGESIHNYGIVYPTLLAPLVGLFDMPSAFRIAHGLGAVLMASAAVPAYLLAQYVSRSRAVALAAAAPVAVAPWLVFSMNLLTEVAAYPIFLWAALAAVVAISEPSRKHDLLAIGALVLLFLTRTQFVFLIALLPIAIVVHEVGFRWATSGSRDWFREALAGLRASASGHAIVAAAIVVGGAIALAGKLGASSLGGYEGSVSRTKLFPSGFGQAAFDHVNEVIVGVAVLPLALALAYVGERLLAPVSRRGHAFAIFVGLTVPALVVIVTHFDLEFAGGVQERYLFYIAPLLVVAAACYLHEARSPTPAVSFATVLVAILVLRTQYEPNGSFPVFSSPTRLLWEPLQLRVGQLGDLVGLGLTNAQTIVGSLVVAAAAAIGLLRADRGRLAVAGLGVGLSVWGIVLTLYVSPKVAREHESIADNALAAARTPGPRDWIDEALPDGAAASLVPSVINARRGKPIPVVPATNQGVWWEAEFWNKKVSQAFRYEGGPDYTPYHRQSMALTPASGALRVSGTESPYLVVARTQVRFAPRGKVVAGGPDVLLYRARRPYRAAWATRGVSDNGSLGSGAGLRVYGDHPTGKRLYEVSLSLAGAPGGPAVTATVAGAAHQRRLTRPGTLRAAVCVPRGEMRVVRLGGGGLATRRLIGVRVAPTRSC